MILRDINGNPIPVYHDDDGSGHVYITEDGRIYVDQQAALTSLPIMADAGIIVDGPRSIAEAATEILELRVTFSAGRAIVRARHPRSRWLRGTELFREIWDFIDRQPCIEICSTAGAIKSDGKEITCMSTRQLRASDKLVRAVVKLIPMVAPREDA